MPTDYGQISAENVGRYGTEVSYYGSDFADRYTERTHFIYELLQNAEDALRWRHAADPAHGHPRSVSFRLFPDHLEVSHFGLQFTEAHVRAICSIKRGTKETSLTDLGKFGIGFKSVYAFTKHPEIHSGDEHFSIDSYVHPRAIAPRETKGGATLFYIPFDADEITPAQAHAEISARLGKLGFRTLLFLNQIESVEWEIVGERSGSYLRKAEIRGRSREVTLVGQLNDLVTPKQLDQQRWLVFSRPVVTAKAEPAGQVEVAFRLTTNAKKDSIVRTDDSTLAVFFPTEKETHCGFLIQGPYKTTPSRDNVPHDNKWNSHLVSETATLVGDTLILLGEMKLASVGLLQSMPLFREWEVPDDWMLRPVYDAVVTTLKEHPLIPAAGGRLVAGKSARIARSRALVDLFTPEQLSLLLGKKTDEKLDWVSPEISEGRSSTADVTGFLRDVLGATQIEPEQLPIFLDEKFFIQQTTSWMAKFYAFLLEHERLWRRQHPRGPLLARPFIRLQDNRQIAPFRADGTPNVYLPSDTESEFDTVHRLLAKPRKCADFLRKLGLTEPDVTTEVLQKVVPQYERAEIAVAEKKHATNLRKIFRALGSTSPSRPLLIDRLKKLTFLKAVESGTNRIFFCTPGHIYFRTKSLETFFEHYRGALFLSEPDELVRREKISGLLRELGVNDRPRRIIVQTDDDWKKKQELLQGGGQSREIYFHQYDIEGLAGFLRELRKLEFSDASRRARLLWDFLLQHLSASPAGDERLFFRGNYSWYYYTTHIRSFDAFFLTLLRNKAWLPGVDGELHRPTELLPQEIAPGFSRHPILCEELQMKAEVLVNLAKQAGIKVEDLVFIRQNRELFERLKKSIKDKQLPDSRPVSPGPNGVASSPHNGVAASPGNGCDAQGNHDHGTPRGDNSSKTQNDAASGSEDRLPGADTTATSRESSQDGTYFTYVYVAHESNPDDSDSNGNNAERAAHSASLGRAGLEAVMTFERTAGRRPTEMPLTHEGYDVESRDANGEIERYIEVKSVSAEWGTRGVTLSSPQFEAARQHKGKYWLYVVDNVSTEKMQIHRIFSPGDLAKSYVYDRGWRQLREP